MRVATCASSRGKSSTQLKVEIMNIAEQLANKAPELVAAAEQSARDARFEPTDYIENIMKSPRLKQILAANLVWTLNNQMISVASSIYRELLADISELRTEAVTLQVQLQSVIDAFRGSYENEGYWGQGNCRKLAILASLRDEWESHAERYAFAAGYFGYQPADIDSMIRTATVGEMGDQERTNLRELAKVTARETGGDELAIYTGMVQQQKSNMTDMLEKRKRIAPALTTIIGEALRLQESFGNYHDLPAVTKLALLQAQQRKNSAAPGQLARFVPTSDFGLILGESQVYGKVLTRVIDRLAADAQGEALRAQG